MHVVATEALYAVATTTIELATGCASHRGSFQSFGTSIKVVLGVLEHHRLRTGASIVGDDLFTFPAPPELPSRPCKYPLCPQRL